MFCKFNCRFNKYLKQYIINYKGEDSLRDKLKEAFYVDTIDISSNNNITD